MTTSALVFVCKRASECAKVCCGNKSLLPLLARSLVKQAHKMEMFACDHHCAIPAELVTITTRFSPFSVGRTNSSSTESVAREPVLARKRAFSTSSPENEGINFTFCHRRRGAGPRSRAQLPESRSNCRLPSRLSRPGQRRHVLGSVCPESGKFWQESCAKLAAAQLAAGNPIAESSSGCESCYFVGFAARKRLKSREAEDEQNDERGRRLNFQLACFKFIHMNL